MPLLRDPRSERASLGFPLGFAPGHYWPRTPGRGPVLNTDRSHVLDCRVEPPINGLLKACTLVSQRSAA